MKLWTPLLAVALVSMSSGAAVAQDPLKVAAGTYTVVVDNPSVRVLKVSVPAGAKTPMHQHPDSVVIPLGASKVKFTMADGKSEESDLASESAMYTPAHTHAGENVGKTRVDALIVEFKAPAAGTATVPSARDNMAIKMLAEGPRAVVYRATAEPTFTEPAGSKHEFDQIVIALGPATDVARDRRQTGKDRLEAGRRAVHRPRRAARIEEHRQQTGRFHHRRGQVTVARTLRTRRRASRSLHPRSADARRAEP